MHYYNEIDPYAAQWLDHLIAADLIPEGIVDRRDISDVRPIDLVGFTSCHFFAGLGGWAYALRLAGWPDDRPVWTGSCPCQPFSAAGKGRGFADERHLWPAWQWLIQQSRPDVIFGEQVDKALDWFDLVATDLEAEGYRIGAGILPAAGGGAPHGRHRLWFVADTHIRIARELQRSGRLVQPAEDAAPGIWLADTDGTISGEGCPVHRGRDTRSNANTRPGSGSSRMSSILADSDRTRAGWDAGAGIGAETSVRGPRHCDRHGADASVACDTTSDLGESGRERFQERKRVGRVQRETLDPSSRQTVISGSNTFWSACDWIYCRDGKYRAVEPGTFPLAHGVSDRVGRLRAYGNAIVPQIAAEFIRAYDPSLAGTPTATT